MAATKKATLLTHFEKFLNRADAAYARKTQLKALSDQVDAIEIPTNVSELTNDANYQSADEVSETVNTAVNVKLSSTYKPAGSSTFAALPEAAEELIGNVYNVTDAFTTTDAFVEGPGKTYPIGTNVVVIENGDGYAYDVLAGFVDLSGLVEKETGMGLSQNSFTNEEKDKLAELEFATDAEVDAMLDEVYGAE